MVHPMLMTFHPLIRISSFYLPLLTSIGLKILNPRLLNLSGEPLVLQVENTSYLTNGRIYEYSISKSHKNNIHYFYER